MLSRIRKRLQFEFAQLLTVRSSNRPWQMALAAALACGLPALLGVYVGQLQLGLVGTLGGLVILYLPDRRMSLRMVILMACAFAFSACYALGLLSAFLPVLMLPMLVFVTVLVTMLCRFYDMPPPGALFFVMVTVIAAYTPHQFAQVPLLVGVLTLGCLLAVFIGFFYSLYAVTVNPPVAAIAPRKPDFNYIVVDSLFIGVFVGVSLLLADLAQLDKPYWVPVSCLAVAQGNSLRAVWDRNVHRILGTAVGLLLSAALLTAPLNQWGMVVAIMVLMMLLEIAIVRHYAVAVMFITPLTILLAEAATLGHRAPIELMRLRLVDTLLGCLLGFLCGLCLHNAALRSSCGRGLRTIFRVSDYKSL